MKKHITAGEKAQKALQDTTKYDPLDIGHAVNHDIETQFRITIDRHNPIFDEKEYCLGYILAGDPLIKTLVRRKFFALLYLPSPRPNQAVFLYNKGKDQITKRLWVLPNAWQMAKLSSATTVPKEYKTMKAWSDAFFNGTFWKFIRDMHKIDMLSEIEYLKANREKLIQAGCKEVDPSFSEPFDFSKVSAYKVVDSGEPISSENSNNSFGKA